MIALAVYGYLLALCAVAFRVCQEVMERDDMPLTLSAAGPSRQHVSSLERASYLDYLTEHSDPAHRERDLRWLSGSLDATGPLQRIRLPNTSATSATFDMAA